MLSRYREDKAHQAAARLLSLHGSAMDTSKLGALLYLVEREALVRFGAPVSHDDFVRTPSGIVARSALDWIDAGKTRELYAVESDPLSPAEHRLIDEIFGRYGSWASADLLEFTRALPEWTQGASPEEILRLAGYSASEIAEIRGEWEHVTYARSLLG
jgi:hypothetical protein